PRVLSSHTATQTRAPCQQQPRSSNSSASSRRTPPSARRAAARASYRSTPIRRDPAGSGRQRPVQTSPPRLGRRPPRRRHTACGIQRHRRLATSSPGGDALTSHLPTRAAAANASLRASPWCLFILHCFKEVCQIRARKTMAMYFD
uniref:Uncharacterized protein n=1 Tax=Triticum urartu TaxID=4572 RepID=A0A8R7PA38_TRIUA